jgi:hypothetical protein
LRQFCVPLLSATPEFFQPTKVPSFTSDKGAEEYQLLAL